MSDCILFKEVVFFTNTQWMKKGVRERESATVTCCSELSSRHGPILTSPEATRAGISGVTREAGFRSGSRPRPQIDGISLYLLHFHSQSCPLKTRSPFEKCPKSNKRSSLASIVCKRRRKTNAGPGLTIPTNSIRTISHSSHSLWHCQTMPTTAA